jgi:hypothetical protein
MITNSAHSTITKVASEQIKNRWVEVIDYVIFHIYECAVQFFLAACGSERPCVLVVSRDVPRFNLLVAPGFLSLR